MWNVKHSLSPDCRGANFFSWTIWVSITPRELMSCTVNLVSIPWTCNLPANLMENHERLQAESHRASTNSVLVSDCNLTSKICNKPSKSVWETTPEFSPDSFFTDTGEFLVALFCLGSVLGEKTLGSVLQDVVGAWTGFCCALAWFRKLPKSCYPFRQEKQSLLSATPLCVGVFPRHTGQRHKECVS